MKKWMILCALIAGLHTVTFANDGPKTITKQEFFALLSKDALLVDAREDKNITAEYPVFMDATRVPFNSSYEMIRGKLPSKSQTIVVYCCGPECGASETLAQKLAEMGYTNVSYLPGGCAELYAQ